MERSINLKAPLTLVNAVAGKVIQLKTGAKNKFKKQTKLAKEKVNDKKEKASIIMDIVKCPDDYDIHIHPDKDKDELVITFKKQES